MNYKVQKNQMYGPYEGIGCQEGSRVLAGVWLLILFYFFNALDLHMHPYKQYWSGSNLT